jgi:hypothetical protein
MAASNESPKIDSLGPEVGMRPFAHLILLGPLLLAACGGGKEEKTVIVNPPAGSSVVVPSSGDPKITH